MQNARLDEAQAGIKIARRNINNLRYADNTTLMAESKKELKSLLMRLKEESGKSWPETQHSKLLRSWHPFISLHGKEKGKKWEVVTDFIYLASKITVDDDSGHEFKRRLLLGRKAMTNLDSTLKSRETSLCRQDLYSQRYGFSSNHVQM